MNLPSFTGPGATRKRRIFWDQVRAAVLSSQKIAGRFVTVSEHPGKGTVINVSSSRGRGPGPGGATGACCADDGSCRITTEADCTGAGGTYQGDNTTCDPNPCVLTGACCYSDGTCAVVSESDCTGAGGNYRGDSTVCEEGGCGACCLPGDSTFGNPDCQLTTSTTCFNSWGAGIWWGTDYGCPDVSLGCPSPGGGSNTLNNPCVGACCFGYSTPCGNVTAEECFDHGGLFNGYATCFGSGCDPYCPLGDCCCCEPGPFGCGPCISPINEYACESGLFCGTSSYTYMTLHTCDNSTNCVDG